MILESVFAQPLDTSFELSQFHVQGSWLVWKVALRHDQNNFILENTCSSYAKVVTT
jgi:hypothetical protein